MRRNPLVNSPQRGGASFVSNRGGVQTDLPSQQVDTPRPFYNTQPADSPPPAPLREAYEMPPAYVVTTYDARPINGSDFSTFSGNNPADVFNDAALSGITMHTYYQVPPGFVAVIREYEIDAVCKYVDPADPVISPDGASLFSARVNFWVDGNPVNQNSWTTWTLPFGTLKGKTYFIAQEYSIVELRVQPLGGDGSAPAFRQCLSKIYGNILLSRGFNPVFEPASHDSIPTLAQIVNGSGK